MYTSNGGTNWSDQSSGTPYSLRSIYFVNSLTGWTVGDLGTILKTSNGGISALNPISNMIPEHYSLYQNYPNPFNPTTKIRFSIPAIDGSNGDVSLKIYDNLGREAATLVNEKLKPGIYEAEFDGSNLSSGVYFKTILLFLSDRIVRPTSFDTTLAIFLILLFFPAASFYKITVLWNLP